MRPRAWRGLLTQVLCIACMACGLGESKDSTQRDREVYAATLDHLSVNLGWEGVTILIEDSLFSGGFDQDTLGGVPDAIRSIPRRLRWRLDRTVAGELTEASVPEGVRVGGLEAFDALFGAEVPAVLFGFTPVVYARRGREALLYYAFFCGGMCGQGAWVYLEHTDTGWGVVEEVLHWVS